MNRNREAFHQEEMILQGIFQVQEETLNREWNLLEVAVLNQEWKLQEEILNREEIVKVQEEEEDKLKADLIVGFFVFYNYYLIQ